MSEPEEAKDEPTPPELPKAETRGYMAGVPVTSIKPDGSAGVRCYFHWTLGETTEEELRETFALMVETAITVFKKTNGTVLN